MGREVFPGGATDEMATFHGGATLTPGVNDHAYVQLFNPAASGVLVHCTRVVAHAQSASVSLSFRTHDVALASGANGLNKRLGAAAAAAEVRNVGQSTVIGTEFMQRRYNFGGPDMEVDWSRFPLVLTQGKGLMIRNQSSQTFTGVFFEWVEIPA